MLESMANGNRRVAGIVVVGLSFVVLGLPDYAHGVAWPALRSDLHRPLSDLGVLYAVQMAGYLLVSTSMGRLTARWGLDRVLDASTVACAASLVVVAVAPAWPVVLLGFLVLGLGSGGMDTGFNAAVALRNDGRLMGVLHAGYGVGAGVGSIAMGTALVVGSWRTGYAAMAVGTAGVLVLLLTRTLGAAPPPKEHHGTPKGVLLPCLVFFVYVSLEVTVGAWAFTYLTDQRHLGDLAASTWVAVYWVGLTAGRLWLGGPGHRHAPTRLLASSVALAVAATIVLWVGGPVAPVGLLVGGLGLSVAFPVLMLVTPERVGPERAAAAVGLQAASGSVGSAVGPWVAGLVLDGAGIGWYGPVTLAMAAALAASVAALRR
jgi:fucose permease